jgi:hypothetical protein
MTSTDNTDENNADGNAKLLTVYQVAEFLHINTSTVRKWNNNGRLL